MSKVRLGPAGGTEPPLGTIGASPPAPTEMGHPETLWGPVAPQALLAFSSGPPLLAVVLPSKSARQR